MKDNFSRFHPAVNFTYFILVIAYSMVFMHPACLLLSLFSAFTYSIYLNGVKAVKFNFLALLPMMLLMALINPAFNHEGVTIITYLDSGSPLTLESIIYGGAAACMIAAVVAWFSCYNAIMTSDKFIYLFGRIIPSLSLLLSMVLRFVPRFKQKLKEVSTAQKCIGRDISTGSVLQRMKKGIVIVSIMISWSIENAIETADSMRSRGYGLKGRTSFSIFHFEKRDKFALISMSVLAIFILIQSLLGNLYYSYFPAFAYEMDLITITSLISYLVLLNIPLIIEIYYGLSWRQHERVRN